MKSLVVPAKSTDEIAIAKFFRFELEPKVFFLLMEEVLL